MTNFLSGLLICVLTIGSLLAAEVAKDIAVKNEVITDQSKQSIGKQTKEKSEKKISKKQQVLRLVPNLDAGKQIYELCASCHFANGWGKSDGSFPVIAGQHRTVVFKQLADIRSRNRENPTMFPFTGDDVLQNAQDVADVSGYIAKLEPNPSPGTGEGKHLQEGKKLFLEKCQACHGENGQGNEENFFPRIQGQHYAYLLRQLQWIRDGRRKNADLAMLAQIKDMDDATLSNIADYVSRMLAKPVVKSVTETSAVKNKK